MGSRRSINGVLGWYSSRKLLPCSGVHWQDSSTSRSNTSLSVRSGTRCTHLCMPRSQQSSTPSTPPPTSSAPLTTHSRVQFASRLSSPLSLLFSSHPLQHRVQGRKRSGRPRSRLAPICRSTWLSGADFSTRVSPSLYLLSPASSRHQVRQLERHKGKHLWTRIPLAGLYRRKTFLINCPPRFVVSHIMSPPSLLFSSRCRPRRSCQSLPVGALAILGRL